MVQLSTPWGAPVTGEWAPREALLSTDFDLLSNGYISEIVRYGLIVTINCIQERACAFQMTSNVILICVFSV